MQESRLRNSEATTADPQPQQVKVTESECKASNSATKSPRLTIDSNSTTSTTDAFGARLQRKKQVFHTGKLREVKLAASDSEAQRQEAKELQQELTRSAIETHRIKAKESRNSATETHGVEAGRNKVKLHFAETHSTRVRTSSERPHSTGGQRHTSGRWDSEGHAQRRLKLEESEPRRRQISCSSCGQMCQKSEASSQSLNLPQM